MTSNSRIRRALVVGVLLAAPVLALTAGPGTAGAATTHRAGGTSASSPGTEATTINVPYSCTFPIIGSVPLVTTITGQVPAAVAPGQAFSLTGVQASTTIPAYVVDALVIFGLSVQGTVTIWDVDAANASPSVLNAAGSGLAYGPVPLKFGHPAVITVPSTPGDVGPFTAGTSGSVTLSAGELQFTSWFGTVTCTVPPSEAHAASISIPISSAALPVGTAVGGFGIAVAAGGVFVWRQRRRSSKGTDAELAISGWDGGGR